MHIRNILPVSLLVASITAQGLVYDNGPIINYNGNGILQTSTGATPPAPAANFHSVFGFGSNLTAAVNIADDFAVSGSMVINEIEFFYYQTGSTTTPTGTGVFVEILDASPAAGGVPVAGSPGFANNLFTTNLVSHTFTGIYKVQDIAQTATNRPIMSMRVSLPTPVVLGTGVYWLQWSHTGSLASGPWVPPISTLDQGVTGNAVQKAGAAAAWVAMVSGVAPATKAQGLPFRLYGAGSVPGSITQTVTGCGSTGIAVQGAPNVGGYIRTTLSGVVGLGLIGYSFNTTPSVFCGCNFAHTWDVVQVATASTIDVPMTTAFCGLPIGVQGVDFGGSGGCPIGFTVTDGFVVTLNN